MATSRFVPSIPADRRAQHVDWLLKLTRLPTASGRESQIVTWIRNWVHERAARITIDTDNNGNLILRMRDEPSSGRITVFDAHMDHPAFVVRDVVQGTLVLEFRGSVNDNFFVPGAPLELHLGGQQMIMATLGEKIAEHPAPFPGYRAQLTDPSYLSWVTPGDIARWSLGEPELDSQGLLHTNATDNLACVVAALAMLDELAKLAAQSQPVERVRLLLTRAEEVGFVGAYAAIRDGVVPEGARVIVLENSKALRSIKVGNGVVIRLGDRISTVFGREVTAAMVARAEQLTGRNALGAQVGNSLLAEQRQWQTDLMPGGACHATLFTQRGFETGCLVLPLTGYHNMGTGNETCFETIAISDFHALVDLLVSCGLEFPQPPNIAALIEQRFAERGHVLSER